MMSHILHVVFMCSFCCSHGATNLCSRSPMRFTDIVRRWPHYARNETFDDSTIAYGLHLSSYGGALVDYPPGAGHCGGKYPIWQKELKKDSAVVCVQNENDTCFKEFEVKYKNCGYYSMYELRTEVKGSVFCLQPEFCDSFWNLCKNGGSCKGQRDGVSCECRDGFSGPTCEGDPCSISKPLPRLEERLPSNHVVGNASDLDLEPGWYSVPKGMEIFNRMPSVPACGTNNPIWSAGRWGNMEVMCEESASLPCVFPYMILTQTCANTKVFTLQLETAETVNYCFECHPGPLDILVIKDVSSSVMSSNQYNMMTDFINNIFRHLDIGKKSNNVAFMSFAKTAKVGFHLNTYDNNMDVMKAVASNRGEGGGTLVSSALELSVSDVFTYHNGDRADADNIVLLFTDGRFKDETSLEQDIETLKGRAEIYVVTVGPVVSNTTLLEMATTPRHILKLGDPSTATVITSALNPKCGTEQETVYEGR